MKSNKQIVEDVMKGDSKEETFTELKSMFPELYKKIENMLFQVLGQEYQTRTIGELKVLSNSEDNLIFTKEGIV